MQPSVGGLENRAAALPTSKLLQCNEALHWQPTLRAATSYTTGANAAVSVLTLKLLACLLHGVDVSGDWPDVSQHARPQGATLMAQLLCLFVFWFQNI